MAPRAKRVSRRENPEANMSLGEHLIEARNRLFIAAAFIILGAIGSIFIVDWVFAEMFKPVHQAAVNHGIDASVNYGTMFGAFDIKLQACIVMGIVLSSPFWIYQFWAYLQPGLTKKERQYSLGFFFAAVPLFLAGVFVAWLIFPHAVNTMMMFIPQGGTNYLSGAEFVQFILRLHLAFGFAFLLPLGLVGANMIGFVTGKQALRSWRIVIFVCILFGALAAPGPDVFPMFALAAPMMVLFMAAVVVCLFNDRRRGRRAVEAPSDPTALSGPRSLDEIA